MRLIDNFVVAYFLGHFVRGSVLVSQNVIQTLHKVEAFTIIRCRSHQSAFNHEFHS